MSDMYTAQDYLAAKVKIRRPVVQRRDRKAQICLRRVRILKRVLERVALAKQTTANLLLVALAVLRAAGRSWAQICLHSVPMTTTVRSKKLVLGKMRPLEIGRWILANVSGARCSCPAMLPCELDCVLSKVQKGQ